MFKYVDFLIYTSILLGLSLVYLKKRNYITINLSDLALLLVIVIEAICYFNSPYKPNSYISLEQIVIMGLMILVVSIR